MSRIKEAWGALKRLAASRTVIAIFAGIATHHLVKKGILPDNLYTDGVEALSAVAAIYFRYIAKVEIQQ